jgi:hypothetical protein
VLAICNGVSKAGNIKSFSGSIIGDWTCDMYVPSHVHSPLPGGVHAVVHVHIVQAVLTDV